MPATLHAALLLMAIAPAASDAPAVWIHRLSPRLVASGRASIDPGGLLLGPVHVSRDGQVLALVEVGGRRFLVRWRASGELVGRQAVDLPGPVATSRLAADGSLLVVAGNVLARLAPDARVLANRRLDLSGVGAMSAGAAGLCLARPGRIVREGLDGARWERATPVGREAEGSTVESLLALEDGGCLVAERQTADHPVSGRVQPDQTTRLHLTRLDPRGEVAASRAFGEDRTRREWFWMEPARAQSWGPSGFGLVRTRHAGGASLLGFAERDGGDLVVALSDQGGERLARLDRGLRELWSSPLGLDLAATALPPPWTRGLLASSGGNLLAAFGEDGRPAGRGSAAYPEGAKSLEGRNEALGQSGEGEWVLVWYAAGK